MKTGFPIGAAAFAAALLGLAAPFLAPSGLAAEPDAGRSAVDLAATCQSCHGRDGISASPSIPNLAGQKADYLAAQLAAFKSGERKNALMSAIAGQLSGTEMRALGAFWASKPAGGDGVADHGGAVVLAPRNAMPADFPAGFTVYHVKDDAEGGTITRNYANAVAIAAARSGKAMPDGSVIIIENLNARRGANSEPLRDAGGALVADKPTSYASMESQANWGADVPALLRNGNWHYATFTADGTKNVSSQAACLACHKPLVDDDFMFSRKALGDFLKPR